MLYGQDEGDSGLLFSPQPSAEREIQSGLFKVAQLEQRLRDADARKKEEESSGLVNVREILDSKAVPEGDSPVASLSLSPLVVETEPAPEPPPETVPGDRRTLLIAIVVLAVMVLGLLAFVALH